MNDPSGVWSAHQLAEFVGTVAEQRTQIKAVHAALDALCETFDAEFAAVTLGDELLGTVGFGASAQGVAGRVRDIVAGTASVIAVPGAGECTASASSWEIDGQPCSLVVARSTPATYAAEEVGLLRSMTRVLGMAIHGHLMVESLMERQGLLERLSVIQRSISRRAGLENVLSAVISGVVELLDADSAAIRLVDTDSPQEHVMVASYGLPEDVVERIRRVRVSHTITGRALSEGTLVTQTREEADAENPSLLPGAGAILMAAPIHDAGTNVGAIVIGFHDPERLTFSDGEQEALTLFAEHASIALTDARAVEAMERAMYDPLTHLPNRILFRDRLASARAEHDGQRGPAVLFVDLDGFKNVNDSMGHHAGDALLTDVALRLSWLVRPGDMVARHGGDEFTVLLQGVQRQGEAEAVAQRIVDGMSEPFTVGDTEVRIGASIGIAFDDGDQLADLVERADQAMYTAKQRGRGRFNVYRQDTQGGIAWAPAI